MARTYGGKEGKKPSRSTCPKSSDSVRTSAAARPERELKRESVQRGATSRYRREKSHKTETRDDQRDKSARTQVVFRKSRRSAQGKYALVEDAPLRDSKRRYLERLKGRALHGEGGYRRAEGRGKKTRKLMVRISQEAGVVTSESG